MNFDDEAKRLTMELDKIKSMGTRSQTIREALKRAYQSGKADAVKFTPTDTRAHPIPPMTFEVEG